MQRESNMQIREEYAHWMTLSKRQRRAHGLPETQSQFAERKGISARALRRWQVDSDFKERVSQLWQLEAQQAPGHAVSAKSRPQSDPRVKARLAPPKPATDADDPAILEAQAAGVTDPDEQNYHVVKASIRDKAADGDREALALYMKFWGHEYAEAERARRDSSLSDLSDVELVDETLDMIGPSLVRSWLAKAAG